MDNPLVEYGVLTAIAFASLIITRLCDLFLKDLWIDGLTVLLVKVFKVQGDPRPFLTRYFKYPVFVLAGVFGWFLGQDAFPTFSVTVPWLGRLVTAMLAGVGPGVIYDTIVDKPVITSPTVENLTVVIPPEE